MPMDVTFDVSPGWLRTRTSAMSKRLPHAGPLVHTKA